MRVDSPASSWSSEDLLPLPLSSVSTKIVVAITGFGLVGFVITHMMGNLQIYLGQEALNKYAYFLKSNPELLWPARIGLLTMFALHAGLALWLRMRAGDTRPVPYVCHRSLETSLPARYMILTGLLVLAFVLFHLAHFTLGKTQRVAVMDAATNQVVMQNVLDLRDSQNRHDVYSMVVLSFRNPFVAVTYIIAQLALAFHLYHGASSMLQTVGLNSARFKSTVKKVGLVVAVVVALGNISIPACILARILRLPSEG